MASNDYHSQPLKPSRNSKSPIQKPTPKDANNEGLYATEATLDISDRDNMKKDKKTPVPKMRTTSKLENTSITLQPKANKDILLQDPNPTLHQSNLNTSYQPRKGYSVGLGMSIPMPYQSRFGMSQSGEVVPSSYFGLPQPGGYLVRSSSPFLYGPSKCASGLGITPVGFFVDPSLSPKLVLKQPENSREKVHVETQTSFQGIFTPTTKKLTQSIPLSCHTKTQFTHKESSIAKEPISTQVKLLSSDTPSLHSISTHTTVNPIVSERKLSRKSSLFDLSDVFCLSCPPTRLDFSSSVAVKYPNHTDPQVSLKFNFP